MVEAYLVAARPMGIVEVLTLMSPGPVSRCFPPPVGVVGKNGKMALPKKPENGNLRETGDI